MTALKKTSNTFVTVLQNRYPPVASAAPAAKAVRLH